MFTAELVCSEDLRRKLLFDNPNWNGIDYVEVADNQLSLCVHFFGDVPEHLTVDNILIEGGRRIRDIKVLRITIDRAHDLELDDCLRVEVDEPGDFSTYCLCIVEKVAPTDAGRQGDPRIASRILAATASAGGEPYDNAKYRPYRGFDPRYTCVPFSFKAGCPSDLDCKVAEVCPPEVQPAPEINYLAKDYASFRQLILDRLALTMPDWNEVLVPDIGVTLVELLAYAADYLSYYQDAVATEAYLDTARLRISVRRHARLVDYRMHEGCNARAWVTVATRVDETFAAGSFYFITGFLQLPAGGVLSETDLEPFPQSDYEVFEPILAATQQQISFYAVFSEIDFYTWGDNECCIPAGATRATLIDPRQSTTVGGSAADTTAGKAATAVAAANSQPPPKLAPGGILIFEEVLGPTTGEPADADPAHRWAVRLTKVTSNIDPVINNQPLIEIEWAPEDALSFSLCVSARLPAPDCRRIDNVSVARGNVILVDHGRSVHEPLGPVQPGDSEGECGCDGTVVESTATSLPFKPKLRNGPLSFREPPDPAASASAATAQDSRAALPQVVLVETTVTGTDSAVEWTPLYDLLERGGDDRAFVVEMDDDGFGNLRFGDGELGRQPDGGTIFDAKYRVGNGTAGNVGRETINRLVLRGDERLSDATLAPRNPMPAVGGTDPEPIAEVKLFASGAFRKKLERAITADDYTLLAGQDPALQRAATELEWTGSWYEAHVAVDPLHTESPTPALLAEVDGRLERYRRMGHDVAVAPAVYVPIWLAMEVCVLPHYARGQVEAVLLDVFSSRRLAHGNFGFFHPDRLTFGEGIYLSQIVAAAMAVEGVETVKVRRFQRLDAPPNHEIENGVLPLATMEIAQLDNDPNFPENGKLQLIMRGGR